MWKSLQGPTHCRKPRPEWVLLYNLKFWYQSSISTRGLQPHRCPLEPDGQPQARVGSVPCWEVKLSTVQRWECYCLNNALFKSRETDLTFDFRAASCWSMMLLPEDNNLQSARLTKLHFKTNTSPRLYPTLWIGLGFQMLHYSCASFAGSGL